MTHPAPAPRLWRSARDLPSRTPLRIKLIAAVLALVTAALAVISIAGIAFLRGYLLSQADQELRGGRAITAVQLASVLSVLNRRLSRRRLWRHVDPVAARQRTGTQVVAEYSGFQAGQPHMVPRRRSDHSDSWLANTRRKLRLAGSPPQARLSAPVTVSAVVW